MLERSESAQGLRVNEEREIEWTSGNWTSFYKVYLKIDSSACVAPHSVGTWYTLSIALGSGDFVIVTYQEGVLLHLRD